MPQRISVTVNKRNALREVMTSNKSALSRLIRSQIGPEIDKKQKELVLNFEKHPVTQEIKGGNDASPISGVTGGYGNLFSFIGFERGSNPTSNIKNVLNEKIIYKVKNLSPDGKFRVTMIIPSLEDVFSVTPIPWAEGASWAEGIEKGISNIGSYVYSSSNFKGSRSGTGLQLSKGFGSTFNTTPYISKIISEFKKDLQKLK